MPHITDTLGSFSLLQIEKLAEDVAHIMRIEGVSADAAEGILYSRIGGVENLPSYVNALTAHYVRPSDR